MMKEKKAITPSSKRKRRRTSEKLVIAPLSKRMRRITNEKLVIAPSSLPTELVEEIFLRLPVKDIIQLKCLSKYWRDTIEARSFAERQLKIAERSRLDNPKIMIVSEENPLKGIKDNRPRQDTDIGFSTICLDSSSPLAATLVNIPKGFFFWTTVSESCDGLFCIHSPLHSIYVVNPATRWLRQLPPANIQLLMRKLSPALVNLKSLFYIAFVKATDYKLVWLYNSVNYNSDSEESITKCEVFDFRTNAWRYLSCTPSYKIFYNQMPASAKGSVYWFTEAYNDEIKIVALDIHTEKFRLLPKITIPGIASTHPQYIDMCTLDDSLCISKRQNDTLIQDIWSLKSSEDAWEKIYTIDLVSCSGSITKFQDGFDWAREDLLEPSTPVAICKSKEILLSHRYARNLVKYDSQTKSLSLFFQRSLARRYVLYFPTLISHI